MALVRYEVKDRVAYVTLNRPEKLNAIVAGTLTRHAASWREDISMPDAKYAHEMSVGECYAPLEFVVTAAMNEQFLFTIQDYHPRYWRDTEEGPPIVHPVLLLQMSPRTRSPSWRLAPDTGSVLGKEHTEFRAPGYVGQRFHVAWTVLEVYEKRGRLYHNTETVITDDQGRLIMRRELHSTFFLRHGKHPKETL